MWGLIGHSENKILTSFFKSENEVRDVVTTTTIFLLEILWDGPAGFPVPLRKEGKWCLVYVCPTKPLKQNSGADHSSSDHILQFQKLRENFIFRLTHWLLDLESVY